MHLEYSQFTAVILFSFSFNRILNVKILNSYFYQSVKISVHTTYYVIKYFNFWNKKG